MGRGTTRLVLGKKLFDSLLTWLIRLKLNPFCYSAAKTQSFSRFITCSEVPHPSYDINLCLSQRSASADPYLTSCDPFHSSGMHECLIA
jgi:hypothetical protein